MKIISSSSTASSTGPPTRVGLVYETFETYAPVSGAPSDAHAEFEPWETVEILEAALFRLGLSSVRVEGPYSLLERASASQGLGFDVALNISEGFGGRNREAWAPVLLEMAGVPYWGSDALTLSLTLDKAWANDRARAAGIPVAPQCVMNSGAAAGEARLPAPFPLFVKPRWEGSAKGIRVSSRVENREALVNEVSRVTETYAQPALVEAFLPGAEYTVMVTGHSPPRAFPVLQRALERDSRIGLHALAHSGARDWEHTSPGELTPALEKELAKWALLVFDVFECRDFARVDFRLDQGGQVTFLEVNPLPTFAPDGTFGILAELEGRSTDALLADVLGEGLKRLGFTQAE